MYLLWLIAVLWLMERAVAYGADLVASTFAFQEGKWGAEPSFEVIEQMAKLPVPCIAEGGIWVPEQAIGL